MPKRSAEEKISYYSEKIKRLKKRRSTKKQRRRVIISSSDSEDNCDNGTQNDHVRNTPPPPQLPEVTDRSPVLPPAAELDNAKSAEPRSPAASSPVPLPAPPAGDEQQEPLDSELLEALGDANDEIPVYGPEIHSKLAERWLPILKKGLNSEAKDKLLKDYVVPENCKLLKAPTVNPEIRSAATDIAKNRDKKIQIEQDQLGLGITAINRAMTVLLKQENKVEAVKILSDACRILSDLHFTQTQLRKKLITRGLDKAFLTNVEEQERDETMYGKTLPEKIKESKAIEKQGKDIKKTPTTPKASTSNAPSQPSVMRNRFQGNWSGPPRYQIPNKGGRGTQYRSQYQHRGGPLTLAPPAYPAPSHPATLRPAPTSTTATGSRRAPTRR